MKFETLSNNVFQKFEGKYWTKKIKEKNKMKEKNGFKINRLF